MTASKHRNTRWTPDEDERIRELWRTAPQSKVTRALPGRNWYSIAYRASRIGAIGRGSRRWPTLDRYIEVATEEAMRAGITLPAILRANASWRVARIRWRIFDRLRNEDGSSLSGIASVSGFDHTSVMHGLRRLAEIRSTGRAEA